MGVRCLRPSRSVRPLICVTTQKPLSFIHQIGFDPHPIASAMYIGWNGEMPAGGESGKRAGCGDHRHGGRAERGPEERRQDERERQHRQLVAGDELLDDRPQAGLLQGRAERAASGGDQDDDACRR